MADKVFLTDKGIKALKSAPTGARYDVWDSQVPGFCVRVTDKAAKTFQLVQRLTGGAHPTRFTIAPVEKISLAAAREKAILWLGLIKNNKDPRDVEHRERAAEKKAKFAASINRFPAVAETYIAMKMTKQVCREEIIRIIRNEFVPVWKDREIGDIETIDVAMVIEAKAKTAPGQARALLNHIKQFFKWCVSTGRIDYSPAVAVDTADIFGPLMPRDRTLTDAELTKVWKAACKIRYPLGPLYQMLILTGCRKQEMADLHSREVNLGKRQIVIPKERMKGKPGKRKPFVIPLTDMMIAILKPCLAKIEDGYLFSKDGGVTPTWLTTYDKKWLDEESEVSNWVHHDLRRTMRTLLETEEVGVLPHIAEEMIAHQKLGMNGVYNQNQYLKEKTAGFAAWNARVATITGGLPPTRLRLVA